MEKIMKTYTLLSLICILYMITNNVQAQENRWYVEPMIGLSSVNSMTVEGNNILGTQGDINVSTDSGFVSGLTLGYDLNTRWSAELGWEYRSNESTIELSDGELFDLGNYASNTFFLNGVYNFSDGMIETKWNPYVGLGLLFIQEIDIDLESAAISERSWSSAGDVGIQAFAGLNYALNDSLSLQAEFRFSQLDGVKLEAEDGLADSSILNGEYNTSTVQLGAVYRF